MSSRFIREYRNLEFGTGCLKTQHPVFQEVALGSDTEACYSQGEGDRPVARFRHHLPGFRVDNLDRFCPLWIICLGLRSLYLTRSVDCYESCIRAASLPFLLGAADASTSLRTLSSNEGRAHARKTWTRTPRTLPLLQKPLAAKPPKELISQ